MMGEVIADANETSGALDRVFAVSSDGAAEMKSAADAVRDFDAGLRVMAGSMDAAAIGMLGLGEDADKAAKSVDTVAGAFGKSVAGFTAFGIGWTGLHWILMGSIEAIATILPALIALGAGFAAGAEGATWIADKMEGVYTATEATSSMLGQTTGSALGLKSVLQQAQTAADPGVYELLGSVLEGAKTQFFNFGAEGVSVIHMLDAFAAKIDVELAGSVGGQLHKMLGTGVSDLQAWGAVLGNIGHLILNLSSEMPGLAEVLVHVLSAFTGFLNMLSGISPGLVTFGMGLEETWRWGGKVAQIAGVLVSSLGGLAGKIGDVAGSLALMGDTSKLAGLRAGLLGVETGAEEAAGGLESAAGVLAGPWGWVIAGAALGLGLLIDKMATAQTAAQAWAGSMESAINKAAPAQGLTDILVDLPKLSSAFNAATASAAKTAGQMNTTGVAFGKAGPGVSQAARDVGTYTDAQNKLIGQAVDLLTMNTKIDGSYYSLNTAMALASAAGLTVGQMFNSQGQMTAVAKQQIANLVEGYKQMDQSGTVLSNDINAINEQMLMQQTKVQALSQAWDGFISNMTSVSAGVAGLYNNLSQLGNLAPTVGSKISAFSGKTGQSIQQIAQDLHSFGASSAQTWAAWDSAVGQANTAIDGFRTAAAAGGLSAGQYTEAIKGIVAQLLPYAKESQTATSMASALAQEAGGPATTSFSSLSSWVGNTSTATKNLNSITQSATQYMSNLTKVAANLASTLDSAVTNAIAQGTINIKGITDSAQKFTAALQQTHGELTGPMQSALQGFVQQLLAAHEPGNDVIAIVDQIMTRAGASAPAIAAMNAQIRQMTANLKAVPPNISSVINVTEKVLTTSAGSAISSGTGIPAGVAKGATGMLVPGVGSGDTVPAMLTPGEAVVPKHLVSAVAPFLAANKVPGFASGGVVMAAPMLPPMPDTTGLALLQQQLSGLGTDVTKDTTQVANAALVTAKAQAALTAAQKTLTTDQADIKTIDAKITAAKALDTKAAATLKAAEAAESTAKSHLTALERLPLNFKDDMAVSAAKNVYNAAASKVTKDKAALAAAAKLVSSDESILSTAKSKEVSAAANYLNMQRLQRNDETALALAQLDQKQTSTQLSQLQTIQAGGAGISSMNDLLLPGTPLSTLAAAMPGVGLAWGAPAVAAAAAVPPLPVNSFDSGGYLPQGLSLAMNNTGAPEPVGGAGGEIHNHISVHLDGQQIQQSVQKSTLRYNIRNNGLATGLMKPR